MDLYPWQKTEIETNGAAGKRGIFASPRLGKTLVTLESVERWNFKRGLVAAPLVVCPMWSRELIECGYRVEPLYVGTMNDRIAVLDRLRKDRTSQVVGIINYDALPHLRDDLEIWKPTALIGDESHYVKGVRAQRARAFRRLAWQSDYTRILTGTPSPNHYGDLWGQLVCLNKDDWGASYERYAQRYLIRHPVFPSKVVGFRNVDELQARMLRYVTIVRREDVFGPDQFQEVVRRVELSPKTRALYDRVAKEWVLDDIGVDAAHVLTRMMRLQQIAAGFLPYEGGVMELDPDKINAVKADMESIVEQGEKAVLFHRFRWESDAYRTALRGMVPVRSIHGDVPVGERESTENWLRDSAGPACAIVQVQSGGVGISFATAAHALFTTRDFSYTTDYQALCRVFAPGERRVITRYEADRTVDQYISQVLGRKESVNESTINADRQAMAYGL